MRTLKQVEKDLEEAREALKQVQGTATEVYSRIVGYYRSVRNWNRGKRQEYTERKLFRVISETIEAQKGSAAGTASSAQTTNVLSDSSSQSTNMLPVSTLPNSRQSRILLFVRAACPACPPAKDAAIKLGLPVDYVDADTSEGLSEAVRRNVHSTPTAILLDPEGKEMARARDPKSILAFSEQAQLPFDRAV